MEKIAWTRVLLIAILVAVIVAAVIIYNALTSGGGACDQWPAGSFDRQYCLETQ